MDKNIKDLKILIDSKSLNNRIKELAQEINSKYNKDKPLTVICVLRGAVMFFTELVKHLCAHGLRGIEAVYSGHTEKETAYFTEIAAKFSLLVTGGSDTHYAEGSRSVGTPAFRPSDELLAALGIN